MSDIQVKLETSCPQCGHKAMEMMAADASQIFYDCTGCGAVLKPLAGNCCGFWSLQYCSVSTDPGRRRMLRLKYPKVAVCSNVLNIAPIMMGAAYRG
jgi:hypothetical protein